MYWKTKTEELCEQAEKSERTGKPELMKELNISLLMEALEKKKEATRVELSDITKISQPTVNHLVKRLTEEGIVRSLGSRASTGGRKAEVFALNGKYAEIAVILAAEGGFGYVVTDLELGWEQHGNRPCKKGTSHTEGLCDLVRSLLSERPKIRALVVGVPGAVSESGEIFAISQIPEWEHFRLKEYLEKEFSLFTEVLNDINAITSGYFISAGKIQDMIYLHVSGGGLGAGVIIDGKLHTGFRSFAGEAGYMQIGQRRSLEECLASADAEQKSGILANIVVNSICVLNPECLMFGGPDMSKEMVERIKEKCLALLPQEVLPAFDRIEDSRKYYVKGLSMRGRELLRKRVQIE